MMGKSLDSYSAKFIDVTAVLPDKCLILERVKRERQVWIVLDYATNQPVLVYDLKAIKASFPRLDPAVADFALSVSSEVATVAPSLKAKDP